MTATSITPRPGRPGRTPRSRWVLGRGPLSAAKARRAHPSLYQGSRRALVTEADRYAYVRAYGDDRALVLFNRSDLPVSFQMELNPEIETGQLTDIFTGAKARVSTGMTTVTVAPMQSAIYVSQ